VPGRLVGVRFVLSTRGRRPGAPPPCHSRQRNTPDRGGCGDVRAVHRRGDQRRQAAARGDDAGTRLGQRRGRAAVWNANAGLGPDWLQLHLTLGDWVADGLLALFFFVAGLELKRELAVGQLADRRAAALPFFAAAGGMIVPALIAIAVSGGAAADDGAWAIPVATDIAFALGVLALVGSALPAGVRVLLLSLAVIDDLAAIALIALLFTSGLSPLWLAGGLFAGALYWLALRERVDRAWLLWALAVVAWVCVHASGVHATVTGIMLGLLTPVRPRAADEAQAPGERFEHRLHPVSAAFVVPVFALAAAGIPLAVAGDAMTDAIALGVFAGLLAGKVPRRPGRGLARRPGRDRRTARGHHLGRRRAGGGARGDRLHGEPADRAAVAYGRPSAAACGAGRARSVRAGVAGRARAAANARPGAHVLKSPG